jgi:hypothetical protein
LGFIAISNLSSLYIQLTIPKKCEALLRSDVVFLRGTRYREVKVSESQHSSARRELVRVNVKAS